LFQIVIHGSVVLDDFRPYKGDIDHTVISHRDLSDDEIEQLFALHDGYRSNRELLMHQLEGTYYSSAFIADLQTPFVGCYIGTGRRGWRKTTTLCNSLIDLKLMREKGWALPGSVPAIYNPNSQEILEEQVREFRQIQESSMRMVESEFGRWMALVHWCARTLYFRRFGQIVSKRDACLWCQREEKVQGFLELYRMAQESRYPYGSETLSRALAEAARQMIAATGRSLRQ
jgi:hypothetical protein